MSKYTRCEFILMSISSLVFAFTTALAGIYANTLHKLKRQVDRYRWGINSCYPELVRACWSRWIKENKKYKAVIEEVRQWMETIELYDMVLKDTLFYAGMIDLESLGNPTLHQPSDGNSRGLGSMQMATAEGLVKKKKLPIKAVGTVLFNPHVSIRLMIMKVEDLMTRTPRGIKKRDWALICYNSGEAAARKMLKGKSRKLYKYPNKHADRVKKIKRLMKGAER